MIRSWSHLRPNTGRRLDRQSSLIQIPEHFKPRQLTIAHQPNRHP
jgi:hypothetical protein